MPLRPCLDCGTPTRGTRCPPCSAVRARARDVIRGNRHQRGYDSTWTRTAARTIASARQCVDCGTAGSRDNPLSADHVIPKAQGGTDDPSNLAVRCRRCNSAKGAR
jgi:5-methylcytosine-specific restriction enzyme A